MLYRIFRDAAANSTNSQTIDVRQDDTIETISVAVSAVGSSFSGGEVYLELSFLSSNQDGVNDTTGVIWSTKLYTNVQVTGTGEPAIQQNIICPMPSLPISSGERIFLHQINSGLIVQAYVSIYTGKADLRPATRRR